MILNYGIFAAKRLREVCEGICTANGAEANVKIVSGYPVTVNHADQTQTAAKIAGMIAGEKNVNANIDATMGGEDFSYMLMERPGAFIFLGNGNSASLHHPEYDFNDEAIPYGTSYWAKLAETLMPA